MTSLPTWQVTGSYFEVCNCYAPCPCRKLGARAAGRSTYDTCDFALSWDIKEGHFGTDDLRDLGVAIADRWDNAEPPNPGWPAIRPPWHLILYVDERATDRQRVTLENIFLGRAGGTAAKNYASAIGEVYAVKPARIELDHTPGREHLRIGSLVKAATASSFATGERISCGIPGHYRPGQELVARVMQVNDAPLHWL